MHRLLPLPLLLALAAPALADDAPREEPTVELASGAELTVGDLLRRWATATGRQLVVEDEVARQRVKITTPTRGWRGAELRELLGRLQVVVVEDEAALIAIAERKLASTPLPAPVIVRNDEPLPDLERPVTLVLQVRHGGGGAIFASLRGVMARDPARSGNILYVQGPERLVITDLRSKVDHYRRLAAELDVPVDPTIATAPTGDSTIDVYEVPAARWEAVRGLDAAKAQAALAAAAAKGEGTCLQRARVDVADGTSLGASSGGLDLSLDVVRGALELRVRQGGGSPEGAREARLVVARAGYHDAVLGVALPGGSTHVVLVVRPVRRGAR